MYFTQQHLGASDFGVMEMVISRCIVAKILEKHSVLPVSYAFSSDSFLSTGHNYEHVFSLKGRIETVEEALLLLNIGSIEYEDIDDGIQITLYIPGLIVDDYSMLFYSETLDYQWQADIFEDENEDNLQEGRETGLYVIKFTDFVILPHELLQNILELKKEL